MSKKALAEDQGLLVECPDEEGVWWFPFICRERKADGWKPCMECTAPDHPVRQEDILLMGGE